MAKFSPTNPSSSNGKKLPGHASVVDEGVKRAQAALMLSKRIQGSSLGDIAAEFNVSSATVVRRIDYAKRNNLLADATDRVLNELVGLAHKVYIDALMAGDVNAARDVMFGTGILSRNNKAQVAPSSETVEMTLAVWREKRAKGYEAADEKVDAEAVDGSPSNSNAALAGEILVEDDDADDLPPERPSEWPPLPPASEALEDDEED